MTFAPVNAEDSCLKNRTYPYRTPTIVAHDGDQEKAGERVEYGPQPGSSSNGDSPPSRARRDPDAAITTPALAPVPVPAEDSITFPEGGTSAWLTVFGSFCAMMSVFGLINSAAVFESWFATHQLADYTPSEIGWIFSLYLFFVFFIGLQVGPLFDAYGPRHLVAVGCILIVASLVLLGFCESRALSSLISHANFDHLMFGGH